jgi:Na+/melibiose symporter-like transporter
MAKKPETNEKPKEEEKPFENTPSELDDLTHHELRLMFERSAEAVLFAKNIQWGSVGSSLLVMAVFIALVMFGKPSDGLANIFGVATIVLAGGVIFVLTLYQSWQYNEISRIVELEKHFSTLYRKIRDVKSRREGNFHRYTLLLFMAGVVVAGAGVTLYVIKQVL